MIPAANGFALLAGVAAAMVGGLGQGVVLGLARNDVATALAFAAAALVITGWAVERVRFGREATAAGLLVWGLSIGLLGATFAHREGVLALMRDVGAGLGPLDEPATVVDGGTVAVNRRGDGHFVVPGRVNEQDVRFVFDTGASAVVLSADTARRIGIAPESLRFRVPVSTANGLALAAPVTLERLAVGPIVVRRVPALVAQPGLLDGNLLGQTFLDRLDSYEVRGGRLVLRARPT